jgi:hypothetical protein
MFDLESLTLQSGAVVVALVSALLAFVWARLPRTQMWLLGLIAPLIIAYTLYWLPAWHRASPSEYSTWAPLFIAPWYVTGALLSSLVIYFDTRRRRRRMGRADHTSPGS